MASTRRPSGWTESSVSGSSTSRTPTSRASEAWPTWSSSYQRRIRSTGPVSACAYSTPVVSWPTLIQPLIVNRPPSTSVPSTARLYTASMVGNHMVRSHIV